MLVVGAALLALAGCGGSGAESAPTDDQAADACKERIARKVDDPSSIQYRRVAVERRADITNSFTSKTNSSGYSDGFDDPSSVTMVSNATSWRVTGEYNAKNAYGGYNPFKAFSCDVRHYKEWPRDNITVDKDGWGITWNDNGVVLPSP
ncbi:hypothetical protein [Tsukamurella strandjordii]|uniref:Lipoprotein n=1 Tax=Tsukamurella strandjordii TaxID=147577 RepID=A0AA90NIC0_9ACTN|nr:hypothetical protein [Tsukamurella strandjordii]MDP0398921.1 hypothetical protein [Tsukamurella strandjordii]